MHRWIVAALVIVALIGSYWVLRQTLSRQQDTADKAGNELAVAEPHFGEALPIFRAKQGEIFRLSIRSAQVGEVDIHGYERKIDVQPDRVAVLELTATHVGVFPIHLHEPVNRGDPNGPVNHRYLATLEVQPR